MSVVANIKPRFLKGKNRSEPVPMAAFLGDEPSLKSLRSIAGEYGWSEQHVHKGTVINALRTPDITTLAKVLFVDISTTEDALAQLKELLDLVGPETQVVAVGTVNDVDFYRKLMRLNIVDYLLKPLTRDAAASIISRALLSPPSVLKSGSGTTKTHKMTLVIGVRGGVGSSLLSTTLAWIVANEIHHKTALIDLDLNFGTSALSFDLETGRGFADALEDPARIDELFIERAIVTAGDNLAILASEMPIEELFLPEPEAVKQMITIMEKKAAFLIVDVPLHLVGRLPQLLEEATDILVVTEQSLAATRDTIRLLGFIKNSPSQGKVSVVVNNIRCPMGEEVTLKDFEASIEQKVSWTLPQDAKAVLEAVHKGKLPPQVAPDSKLVKTVRALAQELTGITQKKSGKGKWLSLGK